MDAAVLPPGGVGGRQQGGAGHNSLVVNNKRAHATNGQSVVLAHHHQNGLPAKGPIYTTLLPQHTQTGKMTYVAEHGREHTPATAELRRHASLAKGGFWGIQGTFGGECGHPREKKLRMGVFNHIHPKRGTKNPGMRRRDDASEARRNAPG